MHETKINFIPLSAACRFCICMARKRPSRTVFRAGSMACSPHAVRRSLCISRKKEAVTPHFFIGLLLFGIGLHFFAKPKWVWWPDDFEMLLFMIGFSLLVSTVQKKEYVYEAVSMICFSLFLYFFKQIMAWLESAHIPTALLKEYWPFVFIGISLLLLLIKRKKSIR